MSGPLWAQYALYNRLANVTLYAACADLSEADRRRDLGAFFRSVHGTLNHLLLGDRIWMTRFEGGSHPSTDLGAVLHEEFEALRAARREMDGRIEAFFAALPAGFLGRSLRYVNNSGFDSADPAEVIAHLGGAQPTHHRAQVRTEPGQDVDRVDIADAHRVLRPDPAP